MLKRKLVLLTLLTVLIAVSPSVALAKETFTVWAHSTFLTGYNEEFKAMAEEWAAGQGVDLEFSFISTPDWPTKMAVGIATDSLPDVVECNYEYSLHYQARDVWMNLDDLYDEIDQAMGGFLSGEVAYAGLDGEKIAIPFWNLIQVFYFRKDVLDEKGLAVPTNWDEFEEILAAAQDPAKGLWGFGYPISQYGDTTTLFRSLIWSHGVHYLDEEGNVTIDTPEMVEMVQKIKDWTTKYNILPPGVGGWDGGGNNRAYLTRQAVAIYETPSVLFTIRNEDPELLKDTVLSAALEGPAGAVGSMSNGYNWYIPKTTKNSELAKDFIRYFFSEENYRRLLTKAGGIGAPTVNAALSYDIYEDPYNKVFLEQVSKMKWNGYPGPMSELALLIEREWILADMLIDAIVVGMPAKDAVSKAHQRAVDLAESISK